MADTVADRVLLAQLTGVARHLVDKALDSDQWATAVENLRRLAGGRVDLLAELAGVSIGVSESHLDRDVCEQIAGLCIEAGADEKLIQHWTNVGRYWTELSKIPPSLGALRRP